MKEMIGLILEKDGSIVSIELNALAYGFLLANKGKNNRIYQRYYQSVSAIHEKDFILRIFVRTPRKW